MFFVTCLFLWYILWTIIHRRLQHWFVFGPTLNCCLSLSTHSVGGRTWIHSNYRYLSNALLTCGVPQDSVLDPLLFTVYTTTQMHYLAVLHCGIIFMRMIGLRNCIAFRFTVYLVTIVLLKRNFGWHPINSSLTHQNLKLSCWALHNRWTTVNVLIFHTGGIHLLSWLILLGNGCYLTPLCQLLCQL